MRIQISKLSRLLRVSNINTHSQRYCCSDILRHVVTTDKRVTIPDLPLHEYLYETALRYPHHVSMECGNTGRKYTFEQVRVTSARVAASLQRKFNLTKGDCIALILPSIPEYPLVFLAASEAGLVSTTVNPQYTSGEIEKQLKDSKPKLIFTIADKYGTVSEAVKKSQLRVPVVVVKHHSHDILPQGAVGFKELMESDESEFKPVSVSGDDLLVLPFSSGTTGTPKGVKLTHSNVVSNLCQMNHKDINLLMPSTSKTQDTLVSVLPMFHIYGLVMEMLNGLKNGSKIVTLPEFEPKSFITSLVQYKPTVMHLVPPLILFLGTSGNVGKCELNNVRTVVTGAAPCGEQDIYKVKDKLRTGSSVIQAHGMTETSPLLFLPEHARYDKPSSVGRPLPLTSIRVVDVAHGSQNQPLNRVGEIWVSGPQVMKGYLNNDEATSDMIDHHGWLKTGDIGYYDEDGDFHIVDRAKELIKVKGFQVAPAELEEILRSHPSIQDAAVIGVPDKQCGEIPKAFVVAKQSVKITAKDVEEFVAKQVTSYKQLAGGVQFLDHVPKSVSGKILRRELRARFANK